MAPLAANGEIVADSGEGYASGSGVHDAVQRVKRRVTGATVEELGGGN